MRERINRLAKGIVDTEVPALELSQETIDETIRVNTKAKRELHIYSGNGLNLKGLIYSSNIRVKIGDNAFGGLKNHVTYEVDSSYLVNGDTVEGSFYLVTNGGEREVPYRFHIDSASSGQTLGSLKTVNDFAEIARKDMDTALRLFEYQDFLDAPFMQDMHVRAVYDGLKGHGNRQNALEEFLVALKVKNPVRLMIDETGRQYRELKDVVEDTLPVHKDNWGYTYMEVTTDAEFIQLDRKMASQADFVGDTFQLHFQIHPEKLHGGRNYGVIRLSTPFSETTVPVMAVNGRRSVEAEDRRVYKERLYRYLTYRQDYESDIYEAALLQNQMQKELDILYTTKAQEESALIALLQAELYLLSGQNEKACLILDENRQRILENREEEREVYCFYQYLQLTAAGGSEGQKESLIRLIVKYMEQDERSFYLFKLLLKLDESLYENPGSLYGRLRRLYQDGCHSPFLYGEACRLFQREPQLLHTIDSFELHAAYYGALRGLIGREPAQIIAALSMNARAFRPLSLKLLIKLYDTYRDKDLLSAICCLMIKGDLRGQENFFWFEKGIEEGVSLTRLYEYYLYSLPQDYDKLLPKEVLLYFSYDNELDRNSKSILYMNILKYMDKEDPIYRSYVRSIEKYAMEQLFESRINSPLAVIYQKMMYRDLIDLPIAKVLPGILKTNRIAEKDRGMRYVIVCHEELAKEDAYPLKDGAAYVPIFSDHEILLFQDAYGNRYMSIDYDKIPALDEKELLDRCYAVYPDHPMLCLDACWDILGKSCPEKEDISTLERAMEEIDLQPPFKKKLLSKVIAYYKALIMDRDDVPRSSDISYLICLDKRNLDRDERVGICESLISQNYFTESYEMIREFGIEGISSKRLLKLCTKMVLQSLFDEDDLLLAVAHQVFVEGLGDSVILDYLCEHFNGTTEQMYRVLMEGIRDHVETYDLEERLVAQMLFTGGTGKIDQVFDLYASRKKTSESIVKAYFTIKCVDYFLMERTPGDRVFEYLEGAINGSVEKEKVPQIYLLALSKYYATLPRLSEERRLLCQTVVNILIGEGMVFAYFKALSRFVDIPGDIMDKEIIEYHGKKEVKPYLQIRILPEEEDFHSESMRQVYKGIYIREKVLFEGEIMEYRVFEEEDGAQTMKSEGSISCGEILPEAGKNRYTCLNEMSLAANMKDEGRLKEKMIDYLVKNAEVQQLFPLT